MKKYFIVLASILVLVQSFAFAQSSDSEVIALHFPSDKNIYLLIFNEALEEESVSILDKYELPDGSHPIKAKLIKGTSNIVALQFEKVNEEEEEISIKSVNKINGESISATPITTIPKKIAKIFTNEESSSVEAEKTGVDNQATQSSGDVDNSNNGGNSSSSSSDSSSSESSTNNNTDSSTSTNAESSSSSSSGTSGSSSSSSSSSSSNGSSSSETSELDKGQVVDLDQIIEEILNSESSTSSLPLGDDLFEQLGEATFGDIKGHFAEEAIKILYEQGVVSGYNKDEFGPDHPLTRAEASKMLLNALNVSVQEETSPSVFPDVETNKWYTPFINRAKELKYIHGYQDGTFRPNRSISRAEFMAILLEVSGLEVTANLKNPFPDVDKNKWYTKPVLSSHVFGLANGYKNGNFGPHDMTTRGQAAVIIVRAQNIID